MGTYKFAKKMFKADLKKSVYYIFSIAVMTAFMLNAINISYNNDIFTDSLETITETIELYSGEFTTRTISANLYEKENLLILLMMVATFAIFCNINHIKRKAKEIAFIISNGGTLADISRYLICVNGLNYILGVVFGLLLGITTIPVFNLIMYALVSVDGKLFFINMEGLSMLLLFIILQFFIVLILNFGYAYRKEIIELMEVQNTTTFNDKRNIRTPGFAFLGIYILSIIALILSGRLNGGEYLIVLVGYVAAFGAYGTLRYFIPKLSRWLSKKNFMYKGSRRIYLNNFLYSLSNSIIYLVGMMLCLNQFILAIVRLQGNERIKYNTIFCIVGSSLMICISLVYNLIVDNIDKIKIYNQLRILGYTSAEIEEIIRKETILFFTFGICISYIAIIAELLLLKARGVFSMEVTIGLVLVEIIPLIIGFIISNLINKKKVIKTIYNEKERAIEGLI